MASQINMDKINILGIDLAKHNYQIVPYTKEILKIGCLMAGAV